MRNTFLQKAGQLILLCLPLLSIHSFSQDIRWEKSYGGIHAEYLFDVQPTADYGFILAGSSLSNKTGTKTDDNRGDLDYWIWKMDEAGEMDWQKSFGGTGFDLLQSIKLTNDGGFILAGTSNSSKGTGKSEDSRGGNDFWVIKLNAGGGEEWQKTIGGMSSDDLTSIVATRDGGYLLGGTSASSPSFSKTRELLGEKNEKSRGNTDYWIVKLDSEGNIKWQKTYGGQYAETLRSMSITSDGGCIVGGYSNSPASGDKSQGSFGEGDFWILKLDDTGNIEWQQTYGGDQDDQLFTISQCLDGNYIAGGNSYSGTSGNRRTSSRNGSDFWVIKMDEMGETIWQQGYDFGREDVLTSIVENKDGSLLIGGHAKSNNAKGKGEATNDYIALKADPKGEELWNRTVGSDGEDVLRKAIETRDGGYLLAGTSNPQPRRSKQGEKQLPISGNGQPLAAGKAVQDELDATKQSAINSVNEAYKEQAIAIKDGVSDAIGQDKDSPFKTRLNTPTDILGNGSDASKGFGTSQESQGPSQKKQAASRDKKNNIGRSDFWVVKLKDKDKKEKAKQNIEAIPNPTHGYTNVIVGYEFEKGTATVFDLGGRQLQTFQITTGRTVPVDLAGLPEGIYIVQIATDVSSDAVKVMKNK